MKRLPWQYILLAFLIFIAALITLGALATFTPLFRIPADEAATFRRFAWQVDIGVVAAGIALRFFGRRRIERWKGADSAHQPESLSRVGRIIIGLLVIVVSWRLMVDGPFCGIPVGFNNFVCTILIFVAIWVAIGGGYPEDN